MGLQSEVLGSIPASDQQNPICLFYAFLKFEDTQLEKRLLVYMWANIWRFLDKSRLENLLCIFIFSRARRELRRFVVARTASMYYNRWTLCVLDSSKISFWIRYQRLLLDNEYKVLWRFFYLRLSVDGLYQFSVNNKPSSPALFSQLEVYCIEGNIK